MASLEGEAPIKQCIIILEKKVRNLEKRKGKLDGYKNRAKEGYLLDKDQQEAISKYDQVVQNLEFSKELLKQFHQINIETEKVLRKQAKRDKIEKQNSDISRLREVLKLQVALKTLSDSEAREGFLSGKCSVNALSEDQLKILDDFHNLVTLSKNQEQSYGQQCNGAAEHLYLVLEKSEKTVFGEVTYKEVAHLIDSISGGCYFERGLLLENVEVKEEIPVKDIHLQEQNTDEEHQQLLNGNNVAVETVCITSNGFEVSEVQCEANPTQRTELPEPPVVENGTPFHNAESMHSQQLQQSINIPVSEIQLAAVVDHQSAAVPQGVMMGGHWANTEPLVQSQLVRRTPFGTPLAAQYFGTSTFDGQRPLRDIVSSMQGNYNFLQESLIEGLEIDQNNVNNSSIVNVPADAVVSSNSPSSSLQPQIIDHHHHLQQDQHPMATIAGSQAGGYPVYHSRLHPPHLLHHHEGQTLGLSTSVPGDVYYTQQQIYQRIPTNVYERTNQQNIHDVMEVKQHQQIPSNISPPSSIAYPSYHSMQRPEDSESECQISGFMMGSVPNVSSYQQQQPQQQQQQLENQKGSYTMNPNADIFHSGFHATSQADVSLANEVQVEQPQNGSSGQSQESKDVGSKTFAQTASAGKSYQEFTNTQNRRGPKPGSQYQRHPNRQQFVNRQGNAIPYNNTNNPQRGGNVSYGGGAKFGGPGGARPPCQGNNFYERNEHYHS